MNDIEELFNEVRECAEPQAWSRGIELSRICSLAKKESDEGLTILFGLEGVVVSPELSLWPDEQDWNCNCKERFDPCSHVIASVICWRQALKSNLSFPPDVIESANVVYSFRTDGDQLRFKRILKDSNREYTLVEPLTSYTTGRITSPQVNASQGDLSFDLMINTQKEITPNSEKAVTILEKLPVGAALELDGKKTPFSKKPAGLTLNVRDLGNGLIAKLEQAPNTQFFKNGICLNNGTLTPYLLHELKDEAQSYLKGREISFRDLTQFASVELKNLKKLFAVSIESRNLPSTVRELPRVLIQTKRTQNTLEVVPKIVYGDPTIAVVEGSQLHPLGQTIPERSKQLEENVKNTFEKKFNLSIGQKRTFTTDEAISTASKLTRFEGEVQGTGLQEFKLYRDLSPQISYENNHFEISFPASGNEGKEAHASQVMAAWKQGNNFVPLIEGGWAPLPQNWLDKYGPIVNQIMVGANEGNIKKHSYPLVAGLMEELGMKIPENIQGLTSVFRNFDRIPSYPLPPNIRAELRSYQQEGFHWLSFHKQHGLGALLADDMGLGKTLQAICTLEPGCLVVVPTSVLFNWNNEIHRFRPDLKAHIYHGSSRAIDKNVLDSKVVLTTYSIARRDIEILKQINFRGIYLDEIQYIKNPETGVAQAVFNLEADYRVGLSGTPVENKLEELWSLFNFLNEGYLGTLKQFQDKVSTPIKSGDNSVLDVLRRSIKPFMLRRTKEEVLGDLPPKTYQDIFLPLADEDQGLYETMLAKVAHDFESKENSSGLMYLETLLRLRQASCHQSLLPNVERSSSSKLSFLLEKVKELSEVGKKVLVFSQWTQFLDIIEDSFRSENLQTLRIDGSTKDRESVVTEFQNSDLPQTLLISLKAGGVGLNLTRADHVFMMDPWWNPTAEEQAADRAHRLGQTNPVIIYRLISKDTVEEKILELKKQKQSLASSIADGQNIGTSLTREDIMYLLEKPN